MSSLDQYPIGHRIIRLDSVDSTNNYAAKLISAGELRHGSVIMADEQTAGRGQRGSSWVSKSGENLLISVVLKPENLLIADQFKLTQFASLGVRDLLTKYDITAEIKWPNDIYVNGFKLCGMLIENQVSSSYISQVIVGIGLNVNQVELDGLEATSMALETGQRIPLMDVAMSLFNSLEQRWQFIKNRQFLELDKEYHTHLFLNATPAVYEDSEGEFIGIITGVTEQGLLKVRRGEDQQKEYALKELRFIRRNVP